MLDNRLPFRSPVGKKETLKHWGIFLVSVSVLCLLHEWLKLPEWLWGGIGFAYYLLFAPASSMPKKLSQVVLKFLAWMILVVIVGFAAIVFSLVSGLNAGYILSLVFLLAGFVLLVWSSLTAPQ